MVTPLGLCPIQVAFKMSEFSFVLLAETKYSGQDYKGNYSNFRFEATSRRSIVAQDPERWLHA